MKLEKEELIERIARLESVVADLIEVVGNLTDGSEYYSTWDNFQADTKDFKYDYFDRNKNG